MKILSLQCGISHSMFSFDVTNAVTRKFCSNDKSYISMCLNISLGLCPQSIVASFKFLL